jgi:Putative peptidoglycan binding domain
MKKLILLSLVGITSIALTHAAWAATHGGGAGGFHGGGFGGGHFGGGFGGARSSLPAGHFSTIPPGHSFASVGTRPSFRQPVYSGRGRPVGPSARSTTAFHRQQNYFASHGNRAAQVSRSAVARPSDQRALSARNHIFARQDGNAHRNWDQHRAYYSNGHWWSYDSGAWIGLDTGFSPWDYYPYYAFDYYPYAYYPGYYADVEPYYSNDGLTSDTPAPDSTVSAVQTRLNQLGYYNGSVDGMFGPQTRNALARYQIASHLTVTGSLSADTLQSLGLQQVAGS